MADKFELNDSIPAAPVNRINIKWQTDVSGNVSAHVPDPASITIPVSSVFGRTGIVIAQSGDYTVAQVTGAVPNTVQVIAGTGLTGGGALSGSVTLNANIGAIQTPWLSDIEAANHNLSNLASVNLVGSSQTAATFRANSAAVNEKLWRILCAGSFMSWDCLDDAYTTGNIAMQINRSGAAPTSVNVRTNMLVGAAGAPLERLHLNGGSRNYLRVDDTTNSCNLTVGAESGTAWIGTVTAHPMMLRTNAAAVIHITAGGNVGIGDSRTPFRRLCVTGTAGLYTDANAGASIMSAGLGPTQTDNCIHFGATDTGGAVGRPYTWIQGMQASVGTRALFLNPLAGPDSNVVLGCPEGTNLVLPPNTVTFFLNQATNKLFLRVAYSTGVMHDTILTLA